MKRDKKIQKFFEENRPEVNSSEQFMADLKRQMDLLPTPAAFNDASASEECGTAHDTLGAVPDAAYGHAQIFAEHDDAEELAMLNANAWKAKALTELDAAVLHEKRRNTISLVAALSACLVIIFVLVAFMHSAPAADFTDISAAFRPDRTPLTGAASSESISFVDKIATPLTGAWTFIQEKIQEIKAQTTGHDIIREGAALSLFRKFSGLPDYFSYILLAIASCLITLLAISALSLSRR